MADVQNINSIKFHSDTVVNENKENQANNIILLHAALAQANKILDQSLRFERFESYSNKEKVDDSYDTLKWDYTKGAIASSLQVLSAAAQVAAVVYFQQPKEIAEPIGQGGQALGQIYSQYNQGNIQAADQHAIESSKKRMDQTDQTVRMLQDTIDRTREAANSATSKAAEAFAIRG